MNLAVPPSFPGISSRSVEPTLHGREPPETVIRGTLGDDNGAYRLGLYPSSHPLVKEGCTATFSQEAQGRVRGHANAEASSTWPHSLSRAARYYSLSLPFLAIRLHPNLARERGAVKKLLARSMFPTRSDDVGR